MKQASEGNDGGLMVEPEGAKTSSCTLSFLIDKSLTLIDVIGNILGQMKTLEFPDVEDIDALGLGQLAGQFPQDLCSLHQLLAQFLNFVKYLG